MNTEWCTENVPKIHKNLRSAGNRRTMTLKSKRLSSLSFLKVDLPATIHCFMFLPDRVLRKGWVV